jgi:tetratricopeptide (TPR) repeat protein
MKKLGLIACFAIAISAFAACAPYHEDMAKSALAQGRVEDAASEIEAALSNDPNNLELKHRAAEIFTRRGVKEYDTGQMIAAQADFQRAVNYDAGYAAAYDYLGLIAFSEHDWHGAINYGQKAAGLQGQPDPVYVQQAQQELAKVQSGGIKPYYGYGAHRRKRRNYDDDRTY